MERFFSAGRGIFSYKRCRLNAASIAAVMALKCWAREEDVKYGVGVVIDQLRISRDGFLVSLISASHLL